MHSQWKSARDGGPPAVQNGTRGIIQASFQVCWEEDRQTGMYWQGGCPHTCLKQLPHAARQLRPCGCRLDASVPCFRSPACHAAQQQLAV